MQAKQMNTHKTKKRLFITNYFQRVKIQISAIRLCFFGLVSYFCQKFQEHGEKRTTHTHQGFKETTHPRTTG
jgi:hypothetical protein